ncbi:hypothetical protein Barb4_04302 [Bacteroidales bacterium Barb4]|nr:hypothetical protein Barb4_04302 [Bacteroidales bacterium Barb4]
MYKDNIVKQVFIFHHFVIFRDIQSVCMNKIVFTVNRFNLFDAIIVGILMRTDLFFCQCGKFTNVKTIAVRILMKLTGIIGLSGPFIRHKHFIN